MNDLIDIDARPYWRPGVRCGRLIVRRSYLPGGGRKRLAEVDCDCGASLTVLVDSLRRGTTQSCGCLQRERARARATHGLSKTKEHRAWRGAKGRCFNKNNRAFGNYGGRGIKMCSEWANSFQAFLRDIGPCPSPEHSLDRYPDNDGDYAPGNCRWATKAEQAKNRRRRHVIRALGVSRNITDWARLIGIAPATIRRRLLRMPPEEALTMKAGAH
jgi:hypothetical protein